MLQPVKIKPSSQQRCVLRVYMHSPLLLKSNGGGVTALAETSRTATQNTSAAVFTP
jgi:hypothetical protein